MITNNGRKLLLGGNNAMVKFQRISEKGMAGGYCPLNENGIIPEEYLPAQTTLPIGTIITHTCSSTFTPQGCLACDGTEYSKSLFLEFWTNYLSMELVQTCTEAEYISMFETYGACPKFTIIPAGASVISQRGSFTNLEVNSNTFISNFEEENIYTFTVTSVDNAETIWTCDINSQTYTSEELANLGILLDGSFEVGESFSVRVSTSQRFKVPYIPNGYFIQQAMTNNELGKAFKAGLPNILATWNNGLISGGGTGAVTTTAYSSNFEPYQGSSHPNLSKASFDASRSSAIYGNSDTVQPKSVALRYFVVIASGVQNESQMNWSEWATSLSGKLNADMSNCTKPHIVETYISGTSWYRVYSDGWCEQGGSLNNKTGADGSITFLKQMANTNYTAFIQTYNSGNYVLLIKNKTTTGFLYSGNVGKDGWLVCGYKA